MIQGVYRHWPLTTRPKAVLLPAHWSLGPSCYFSASSLLTFYWMALTILVHFEGGKCSAQYAAAVERCTPNGLFSWIRQAKHETGSARETDGTQSPTPKQGGSFISSPCFRTDLAFANSLCASASVQRACLVLMIKPLQQVRGDLQRKLDADSCPSREREHWWHLYHD